MNWKLAGMAGTALVTVALTGVSMAAAPSRFTGNVSLAVSQTFEDDDIGGPVFDDSFTSLSGTGQVNVAFSNNLNLELEFLAVGSFVDSSVVGFSLDRDAGFQGAAHFYWRSDAGAFGVFAGAGVASTESILPSADFFFVGAEGQYYLDQATLGLRAGFLDSSADNNGLFPDDDLFVNNAWFVDAEVRWYVSPKFALKADVGFISGEAAFGNIDVDVLHWGAKAEYWPEPGEPLSLWVAYEGRSTNADFGFNEVDKDVHTAKIGITFHFGVEGGSSREQDRFGPAFEQMDYGAIVVGG